VLSDCDAFDAARVCSVMRRVVHGILIDYSHINHLVFLSL
jgi:hypothetical protein